MVIFSLGGLWMASRGRLRSIRCIPGFLPVEGPPRVILDPFPGPDSGTRGVLEGGRARLLRGDEEVASQPLAESPLRKRKWSDLDLLAFAGTNLWTWVGLPLVLDRPEVVCTETAPGWLDVTVPDGWPATSRRHILRLDRDGQVVGDDEGPLVHELREHCEFGGVVVATRRRTRSAPRLTVLWGDVVAAALHGKPLN